MLQQRFTVVAAVVALVVAAVVVAAVAAAVVVTKATTAATTVSSKFAAHRVAASLFLTDALRMREHRTEQNLPTAAMTTTATTRTTTTRTTTTTATAILQCVWLVGVEFHQASAALL